MNDHLPPETLGAWAQGDLDGAERARVEQHLERCGRCRAESDLAREFFALPADQDLGERSERLRREFERRMDSASAGPASRRSPAPLRRALPWLLAAAAVVVAVVGARQMLRPEGPPDPGSEWLEAGAEPDLVLEVARSPEGWTLRPLAQTGLEELELEVEDSDGNVVLHRSLGEAPWTLRESELGGASPERDWFARIQGIDAQGRLRASPPQLLAR